jgi:uncharacterized OsmC-like protein
MSDEKAQTQGTQEARLFSISLDCTGNYEFRVKFDGTPYGDLVMDEPPPLGADKGPNPARLLAAAVGGCLSASLMFSARKLRLPVTGMHTDVRVELARNEKGRWRIGKMEVEIDPAVENPDPGKWQRCLDLFEDFCIVTQSVRKGIDVAVKVRS